MQQAVTLTDELITDTLHNRMVGFVRHARANNYKVGIAEQIDAIRVAEACGVHNKYHLKIGLKALLCSNEEDWKKFDEMFDAYWIPSNVKQFIQPTFAQQAQKKTTKKQQKDDGAQASQKRPASADTAAEGNDEESVEASGTKEGASSTANQAKEDFHSIKDPDEMRRMERLVERLAKQMKRRISRRYQYQSSKGKIDLRRTLRQSLRYGGTPLELSRKRLKPETPRLIIILDVSRSMAMYSFLFLRFARGLISVFRDCHAYAYHTHLLPITDALKQTDLMRVRNSLNMMSEGWSGGTRIGESLEKFNQQYGQSVNKKSLVMIVSDGLDAGEPEQLSDNMKLLKRRARQVIWLNPLLGQPGYEPVAAGMTAALPHIDLFAPANNLQSLAALEDVLTRAW
jgi:uncharacterized protein with von Willebrand factor type A (vWA) domain